MDRIARLLVRRSRWVLAATAALTLLAAAMLPRVSFDVDITSFLMDSTPEGRALAELQETYGVGDPITVLLTRSDGSSFIDREGLAAIAATRDRLAAVEGVASVGALVPNEDPLQGRPLDAERIEGMSALVMAGLTQAVRASPAAELLLAEEGRQTMLFVLPDGEPVQVAERVRDVDLPAGVEATFAGNPLVFAELLDALSWFLLAIPPVVIVLLLAVFALALGAPRLAALAIVPAVLGSIWTFGLIFGLGLEVDLVTVVVPIFVIVMGSADGLHFVSHLQDAAERGDDDEERVAAALREVGVPMILTTISTAAGFLSLLATGVAPLQQLGAFVALGIGFAGVISFFTLPALLARLDIPPRGVRTRLGARVVRGLEALATRRWTAVTVALPLLAFTAFFLPRVDVVADPLFFFKDGHPIQMSYERIADAFGGATPLFGEFAFDRSAPPEPQLESLRDASARLEGLPGVRDVVSAADLAARLPGGQRDALLSGELTLPMGPMVVDDGLRFMVFPDRVIGPSIQAWRDAVAEMPEVTVFTGTPLLFEALARVVVRAQGTSLALAFVLVAILLLATYRRWATTLVALLPLGVTIATLLAFLAASRIQLNLLTAVASSIVIGVGIDYAIHLIAALQHAREAGPGWVRRAIRVAGRPILANAVGVPVGLSALFFSPLAPHGQIATLMWVAMLTAAITTFAFIPAFEPRQGVAARD